MNMNEDGVMFVVPFIVSHDDNMNDKHLLAHLLFS